MGVHSSAKVDTGLSCLVFMARFLRLPVEPDQIRFEAGKVDQSFTARDIVRAAQRLDLKARHTKVPMHRLEMLPLPAIPR
jgi:subfamily B ATP-binding cassette protein HlyB/CyaB